MKIASLITGLCVVGSSIVLNASAERSAMLPVEAQYAVSAALGRDQTAYHVMPMTQTDPASPKGAMQGRPCRGAGGLQGRQSQPAFRRAFRRARRQRR